MLDETIENQGRRAPREKDLVTIGGVSLPLDDNVGMFFKRGDDFLRSRSFLAVDHTSLGLVDDFAQQPNGAFQLCCNSLGTEELKALVVA